MIALLSKCVFVNREHFMEKARILSTLQWLTAAVSYAAVCSIVYAQPTSLESRLTSTDATIVSEAAQNILLNADHSKPLLLMNVASHLMKVNRRDEAVFWFYAGQLRARYSPEFQGENKQLIPIFVMIGEQINRHAQKDILGMEQTIQRVLTWDDQTFNVWAKAHARNPSDEKLASDRAHVRDNLVSMMAELKSNREHYEKLAREYKSPEDQRRESQKAYAVWIERSFTTRTIERAVDRKMFRFPANFLTPGGLDVPVHKEVAYLTLTFFLPELSGFNPQSPLDLRDDKNVMWLTINDPNEHKNAALLFEAFIATKPPVIRLYGAETYVFDAYKNTGRASLPLRGGSMNEHVFRYEQEEGESAYMACNASISDADKRNSMCQLFMRHSASGLRVNVKFRQIYEEGWKKIVSQLNTLLDTWYVPH